MVIKKHEKVCKCCNSKFYISDKRQIYCNRKCRFENMKGKNSPKYKGRGTLSGFKFADIKCTAKKHNIDFMVTIDEAWEILKKQNFKCNLSGEDIELFENKSIGNTTASFDRIDSNDIYRKVNMQWIHKDVQGMKWHLDEMYFIKLCSIVDWYQNTDIKFEPNYYGLKIYEREPRIQKIFKGYGNIYSTYWSVLISNAKNRKIDFNLSIKDSWDLFVKQEGRCALTGLPIQFRRSSKDKSSNQTASLDRIDNNIRNYNMDNVWWLHKNVNRIKFKLSVDRFLELCHKITNYRTQKMENK